MPTPESETASVGDPLGATRTAMRTSPPGGVNLIALSSRMSPSCRSSAASPTTGASSNSATSRRTPFRVGNHASRLRGIESDVVEEHAFSLDWTLSGVGAGQRQQVLDDAPETNRFALDAAQRVDVFVRGARTLERDLGAASDDGQRRAELVRGVGHEASHLLHRALDWRRGLAGDDPPADRDQNRGDDAGRGKLGDERRVAILQLDFVGNRDRDQSATVGRMKRRRLRAKDAFAVAVGRRTRAVARRACARTLKPRVERGAAAGGRQPGGVGDGQSPIRDSQLIDGRGDTPFAREQRQLSSSRRRATDPDRDRSAT